ncbi:protein tramtrack, beta isoform-like isoform X5 [Maniola jurtina]|uniref:protein tramtrack, beta isoform-like isoform X5 n=1 Tax=Maniola jurtina TaxID=191418 RepID=UPI001E68BC91|nr:protein tramtrack, beta isoform-like isoform X5 [Maniola jurtina]
MASDEQFSLCWNNFHANMSAGFHGLLSRGDLVDVTLAAEGRLLQAHKLVLSVCSPYFQEMFKMNPTHHPIVFLKDVSHSALRDLLQFMYQGEVNVKQEELASFISTAEQLQVKGLTGNQNEESSTPSKPKPTSRPGPRSSQQRQSVMTKLETDLDSKPSSTPVAIKRPNRPSIASNNSSSSQSGPVKRKCVDPLEAGPSGSAKEEFVTIPDEDENNAVAPKMEPEFVNESMWDEDDDGTNNDETNFGEDDSNMEMSGFDGSTTGDGNITGGGEGGAVGDAQEKDNNQEPSEPVKDMYQETTTETSKEPSKPVADELQVQQKDADKKKNEDTDKVPVKDYSQEAGKKKEGKIKKEAKKQVKYIVLGEKTRQQVSSGEAAGKHVLLEVVANKKVATKEAGVQAVLEATDVGKVLGERATLQDKTFFHTLQVSPKWKNCTVCYKELRTLMSAKAADKRVKRTPTVCVECNKVMCSYCFNITHPIDKPPTF